MEGSLAQNNAFLNIFAGLFAIFGAAALFLATIGLYGVLSFSVAQRSQEVGLRMALGAAPRDVWRLIIGQGFRQLAVGLGIGLVLAILLGRGLAVMLYQVSPTDPIVIGSILLVLSLAGLAACYFPARRAVRVDPLDAMRAE
jgi:ABC-type antimicrobial peptide transport system permease subunit